ncbi:MAG TPA: hypothetical protein VK992_00235 [Candidatus Caenarcaniphilales bacterium]|nr:hypothetical protein [Candidatus Caenarcaniphilales bacterium]
MLVVLFAGLLIAAPLAWIGGEMHYRNCLTVARALPDDRPEPEREFDEFTGNDAHADEVARRVRECSRLPF